MAAGLNITTSEFPCLSYLEGLASFPRKPIISDKLRRILVQEAIKAEFYGRPIQNAKLLCKYLQMKVEFILESVLKMKIKISEIKALLSNNSSSLNYTNTDKQIAILHILSTKLLLEETLRLRQEHCKVTNKIYSNKTFACENRVSRINLTVTPNQTRNTAQANQRIQVLHIVGILGNASSAFCLVILIAIYLRCEDLRATFPFKCIIGLSCIQLVLHGLDLAALRGVGNQEMCTAISILTHWSAISSFIWLTCASLEQQLAVSERIHLQEGERFILYLTLAFGVSATDILVCIILNFSTKDLIGYGRGNCFFMKDTQSNLFSFILPLSLLLVANFTWTVQAYKKLLADSKSPNDLSVTQEPLMSRHRVCIAVMTLALSAEILFGRILELFQTQSFTSDIIATIAISFQGVSIFIVFACNKKVFASMKNLLSKSTGSTRRTYKYRASVNSKGHTKGLAEFQEI